MGKRIFLIFLGVAVTSMGVLFVWLMARSYQNAVETRTWVEAPARILESRIQERQIGEFVAKDYAAFILYGYEYNGTRYTSERISPRETKWAKERKKVDGVLSQYPVGSEQVCYLKPDDVTFSILVHDTKAAGYSIWFPTLFVIGGLGIIVGGFLPKKHSDHS